MTMRYLNYSGASKIFIWLAEKMADFGHDVTMFVFSDNITSQPSEKVKLIHEDLAKKNIIGKIISIRNIIKKSNADISISFLLDANVYNTLACKGLKTKSVICERSDPFKPGYYKLKVCKPLFSFADGAVFQLKKVSEYYSNINGCTMVIPNPVTKVSEVTLRPFNARDKLIVTVGRIALEQKRNDIQVKAFSIFHEKYPDYKLIMYGDSSTNDNIRLKQLICEMGLEDCIIMPGSVDNVQNVMKDCQIYLLSSDYEGIPNSLIEAMVMGMPCISTDCRPGGASLLIKNEFNGILVPCGDYKILADKMCWLVEHPDFADGLGKNATLISKTFSEDKIANMWNEYLNNVIKL